MCIGELMFKMLSMHEINHQLFLITSLLVPTLFFSRKVKVKLFPKQFSKQ